MILEIAEIHILEGTNADFEAALQESARLYMRPIEGFIRYELQRGIENPQRYMLFIWWETVEAHMVNFRQSPVFAQHRALISPYAARDGHMEHFMLVAP